MTRRLTFLLLGFVALAAFACGDGSGGDVLDESGTPVTRDTVRERYSITLGSEARPIPMREIHEWRVTVRTPDGRPVDSATISIDGGMPAHQHGLPTVPRVTESLGDGAHRIEGMKFSMSGHWTLDVTVLGEEGSDTATFDLVLP